MKAFFDYKLTREQIKLLSPFEVKKQIQHRERENVQLRKKLWKNKEWVELAEEILIGDISESEGRKMKIKLQANNRYWEDGTINGEEDVNGDLVPFRIGDDWCPEIDVETGIIIDWPKDVIADIHYKVCDMCFYKVIDDTGEVVSEYDDYVPDILCPEGEGYGDYIIMKIDGNGKINKWNKNLL